MREALDWQAAMSLVLSLFPGIGLLDMAFEEHGFCVVRGPDLLWGGDIRRFHPPAGRFDGVIGGPPCQAFSRLRHFVEHNGLNVAENLIPEFERCVAQAQPNWFLMENVPAAPEPSVPGYIVNSQLVRDHWCGGATSRERRFSFGSKEGLRPEIETLALHTMQPAPTVTASGGAPPGWKPTERHLATRKGKAATSFKTARYLAVALRDQGLPSDFLDGAPFTVAGKIKAVGNGVPLALGCAVAKAVRRAIEP
jgi:DNA (cytosine-5)-methyltransferase 1